MAARRWDLSRHRAEPGRRSYLRSLFMICSPLAMRYVHAATRPLIPNDALREAMLAFVLAFPAFWAIGEAAVALGY